MQYKITIEAKIQAQNFASAQKKCAELVKAVERKAEWSHTHLHPEADQ